MIFSQAKHQSDGELLWITYYLIFWGAFSCPETETTILNTSRHTNQE